MKKYIIFLFFLTVNNLYGQADTIIRLDVVAGGSANFNFNSYTKIISGIEYTNWTSFRVYFKVHDGTGTGTPASTPARTWELLVHSLGPDPMIGDDGNPMNLNTIEIAVENAGSGTATFGVGTYVPITSTSQITAHQLINSGTNPAVPASETIVISYYVGGTNSVLGVIKDYYFTDLVFTLNTQ